MYGSLGAVNVKLAQAIAPGMAQITAICQGVQAAGIIGPIGTEGYTQCAQRAVQLHLVEKKDPQTTANIIATEIGGGGSAAAANGKPNYLLWGAIGAVVLVGGAWFFTRR